MEGDGRLSLLVYAMALLLLITEQAIEHEGCRGNEESCGSGSGGGRCPSLGGYVAVTGATEGRPLPEGARVAYVRTGL
jgi:hypothetical protein